MDVFCTALIVYQLLTFDFRVNQGGLQILRDKVQDAFERKKANAVGAVKYELGFVAGLRLASQLTKGHEGPCKVFDVVKSFRVRRVLRH
jgi:hypothetical protein